jgi:hypothetical protein
MTIREIIDVQLESFFGDKFPQKIQRLIDHELNQGRWMEGYDLAVCQGVIEGEDARKLLAIILAQNPQLRIDESELKRVIEMQLPQSYFASISWIVAEDGTFALTDNLRVARFEGAAVIWRSARISYDGIEFDSLADRRLRGRGWFLSSHAAPDSPFTFDFDTGELLEGNIVQNG